MESEKVKEFVKKRYGEIAQSEQSCCCSSSCCGPSTKEIAKEIGYSETDLVNVPDSAVFGLDCGNPVALANLREGETVLDLGSGGGIDVFLTERALNIYSNLKAHALTSFLTLDS